MHKDTLKARTLNVLNLPLEEGGQLKKQRGWVGWVGWVGLGWVGCYFCLGMMCKILIWKLFVVWCAGETLRRTLILVFDGEEVGGFHQPS